MSCLVLQSFARFFLVVCRVADRDHFWTTAGLTLLGSKWMRKNQAYCLASHIRSKKHVYFARLFSGECVMRLRWYQIITSTEKRLGKTSPFHDYHSRRWACLSKCSTHFCVCIAYMHMFVYNVHMAICHIRRIVWKWDKFPPQEW